MRIAASDLMYGMGLLRVYDNFLVRPKQPRSFCTRWVGVKGFFRSWLEECLGVPHGHFP
ncbi:hypothetical protein PX52LOC_07192 [Limnoglobus roseus]|uniref:Uncharacterized protein n=1 Tax=Limnoglobus roseus TaxID=2598579 RepID=A0A5C1AS99_9BACT|nr:hypothetical protein PX52LOC_07192 [Limnoglobus roseus]